MLRSTSIDTFTLLIRGVCHRLVQDMLAAKRDLDLPRMLRKLDNFDLLVIDDLGYLPQGADESEVLFTLIAERYERRSLGITSNLVFSEWEKIFANPMATAAAIDRIVHHSVILEFDMPSYRTGEAQERQLQTTVTPKTTITSDTECFSKLPQRAKSLSRPTSSKTWA